MRIADDSSDCIDVIGYIPCVGNDDPVFGGWESCLELLLSPGQLLAVAAVQEDVESILAEFLRKSKPDPTTSTSDESPCVFTGRVVAREGTWSEIREEVSS